MSYQNIVLVYSLYSMIGSPRVCFASKARFTRAVSTHAALLAHARLLWFAEQRGRPIALVHVSPDQD